MAALAAWRLGAGPANARTTLRTPSGSLELQRGQSAFVYADEQVSFSGEGMFFVGGPGLR